VECFLQELKEQVQLGNLPPTPVVLPTAAIQHMPYNLPNLNIDIFEGYREIDSLCGKFLSQQFI
jgi:hypothetical protein